MKENAVPDPLPSIPQRVEKGIAWLEEQGAYDWAEKIVAAVEAESFNMRLCESCAVGSALGDYYDYFPLGPDEFATNLGFLSWLPTQESGDNDDVAKVEREWERRAREHAAYRAEVLGG